MLTIRTDLTADTVRLAAPSATQLAATIAQLVWPNRRVFWRPGAAVLLPLNRWRESVAGVPLIHFPNNSVLLATNTSQLSPAARNELLRLRPPGLGVNGQQLPAQVFLVGNINSAVQQQVQALGFTTARVRGANSLATAAAVAREIARTRPNPPTILVPYNNDIDSQPATALAAHGGAAIMFVNFESIPLATRQALLDIRPEAVYLLGRDAQISSALRGEVQSLLPGTRVLRVGGETASDYSVNVARFQDFTSGFGWGRTEERGDVFSFVATGNIYQSIYAATLAHLATHAPEIIIPSQRPIPEVVRQYIIGINPPLFNPPRPPFMRGWIIGERSNISVAQQIELEGLLIKEQADWPPPA